MVHRQPGTAIATHVPGGADSAERARTREDSTAGEHGVMRDAVAAMIESCGRYATAYAALRRTPIGCDPVLGPTLLEVLRGMAALTSDGELADRVSEVISAHALDLEE